MIEFLCLGIAVLVAIVLGVMAVTVLKWYVEGVIEDFRYYREEMKKYENHDHKM